MRKNIERKHQRIPVLTLLTVSNPNTTVESARAAAKDISMGGMAFESSASFYVGDTVIVRFVFSNNEIFVFDGVVRRIENELGVNIYGIKFQKMKFMDKLKLRKLIARISKRKKKL